MGKNRVRITSYNVCYTKLLRRDKQEERQKYIRERTMAKGDLPVLVGVGQSLSQWDGSAGPAGAPSPLSLMVDASKQALADTGAANVAVV